MNAQAPIPDWLMQQAADWFAKPAHQRFNVCRPSHWDGCDDEGNLVMLKKIEVTREQVEEWQMAQQKASLL